MGQTYEEVVESNDSMRQLFKPESRCQIQSDSLDEDSDDSSAQNDNVIALTYTSQTQQTEGNQSTFDGSTLLTDPGSLKKVSYFKKSATFFQRLERRVMLMIPFGRLFVPLEFQHYSRFYTNRAACCLSMLALLIITA